jgi:hypothetical protein
MMLSRCKAGWIGIAFVGDARLRKPVRAGTAGRGRRLDLEQR